MAERMRVTSDLRKSITVQPRGDNLAATDSPFYFRNNIACGKNMAHVLPGTHDFLRLAGDRRSVPRGKQTQGTDVSLALPCAPMILIHFQRSFSVPLFLCGSSLVDRALDSTDAISCSIESQTISHCQTMLCVSGRRF